MNKAAQASNNRNIDKINKLSPRKLQEKIEALEFQIHMKQEAEKRFKKENEDLFKKIEGNRENDKENDKENKKELISKISKIQLKRENIVREIIELEKTIVLCKKAYAKTPIAKIAALGIEIRPTPSDIKKARELKTLTTQEYLDKYFSGVPKRKKEKYANQYENTVPCAIVYPVENFEGNILNFA